MTSASELFHNRRSRFGRNSDVLDVGSDFGSPSPLDRAHRRNRPHYSPSGSHTRRDRLDLDGCDPLRRDPHHPSHRQPSLHRISHPPRERDSVRIEQGGHLSSSGNVNPPGNHSNVRDRVRANRNDRLPGAVLLARERLLQRLRGVTLSGSRRNNRNSSADRHNDVAIGDDFWLVDSGDWETEISREWLSTLAPWTDSPGQETSKRPPGLTQEALNSLPVEVFYISEEGNEEGTSGAFRECSICLESFSEGDEMIRLPCEHRYHFCCLEPWVQTCGDCPYCRRDIDIARGKV